MVVVVVIFITSKPALHLDLDISVFNFSINTEFENFQPIFDSHSFIPQLLSVSYLPSTVRRGGDTEIS